MWAAPVNIKQQFGRALMRKLASTRRAESMYDRSAESTRAAFMHGAEHTGSTDAIQRRHTIAQDSSWLVGEEGWKGCGCEFTHL